MSESIDRVHIIFKGEVQGVGFRYTAQRVAADYPEVTGMVRNLPDGAVELVAEGSKKDVDCLLSDIKKLMNTYINDISLQWSDGYRQYKSFSIGF